MKRIFAPSAVGISVLLVYAFASFPHLAAEQQGERGLQIKVGASRQEVEGGRTPQLWAVVLGVSRYKHGGQNLDNNQISNLKYAAEDAQAVYDFLRSDEGGGFRDVAEGGHMVLLKDEQATKAEAERALSALKQARPEDYFVIYIAAHGVLAPQLNPQSKVTEEIPYFLLYDTDPTDLNDLPRTALRMDRFRQVVSEVPAKKGLVLSDTCHSAGVQMAGRGLNITVRANSRYLEEMEKIPEGVGFISAAYQTESSYERDYLGHGVFTWCLLEALRGNADANQDRMVTFDELSKYLSNEVPKLTEQKQHPHVNTTAIAANRIPLSVVNYAKLEAGRDYGTLVIRAPDIDDGVEVAVDGSSVGTLSRRTERTVKLTAGPHKLAFIKGARREERQATVEPGKSLTFEVNITFSESDSDSLFEPPEQQVNVYLREEKEPSKEARDLLIKGVDHLNKQRFAEAIASLNQAVQANGGAYADALVYRGRAEQSLGRYRDAVASFRQALALRPTDYQTRTLLAEARFNAEDNVEEVVKELREIINRHPRDDYPRVVLGDVYFWRHELIKAEQELKRATLLNQKSPPAHMILAEVLTERGAEEKVKRNNASEASAKFKEAIEEGKKALQLFDELSRKRVSVAYGLKRLSISHVIFAGGRYTNDRVLAEANHILAKALTKTVELDETIIDSNAYLDPARNYLQEALHLARKADDRRRLVLALDTSAQNHLLKGNLPRAIEDAEQALKTSEAIPDLKDYPEAHFTLYLAYNSNQGFGRAAEHLQKYIDAYRPKLSPGDLQRLEEELSKVKRDAKSNRRNK